MPRLFPAAPFDCTGRMTRDPYRWISRVGDELGTDCFATRLLLHKVICLRGEEGARLFYDATRFSRRGAAPLNLQLTLLGRGGVQGLDGEQHLHRKQMFVSLLGTGAAEALRSLLREEWRRAAARWGSQPSIRFYDECTQVIFRTACAWAGVPVIESEFPQRLAEVVAMYEHADSLGPRGWWTIGARRRSERWLRGLVEQIRQGRTEVQPGSAASAIAQHRDLQGELLTADIAAVELLNVIRPMTAVAVYVTQAALAMHKWPEEKGTLVSGGQEELERFAQEVRRYYPFFPSALARVRESFEWNGQGFPRGTHVLLDLYGTNHHTALWNEPEAFRPERFRHPVSPFQFIPQGGGDASRGHRCPGDLFSVTIIKESVDFLVRELTYEVPPQDLELNWKNMPALPRSGLELRSVRFQHG